MIKKVLLALLFIIMAASAVAGANKKYTLCIDAGHGGKDAGAPGSISVEKNINLNVALAFGQYVERNCPDVKVVYTRKTDVFIPLYERAEIANRNKADLFVSVHTNALKGNHNMRGFETYTLGDGTSHGKSENLEVAKRENAVILLENNYQQHYVGFDPNSPESNIMFEFIQYKNLTRSIELAKMMQRQVCKAANRPNKGVHQQNLAVLRLASMPACLIELGYISTPDEEQMLNNRQQIDNIARGIYNAFVEYKNKYDTGMTVPYKTISDPLQDSSASGRTNSSNRGSGNADRDSSNIGRDSSNDRNRNSDNNVGYMPERRKSAERKANERRTLERRNSERTSERNAERRNSDGESDGRKAAERRVALPNGKVDKSRPVFKVQVLIAQHKLKSGDRNFKGLTGCESFEEGGMVKYTYGSSNNYNEIYRLRKDILDKFPGAFIIAFKNGEKMDVNQGIREFKQNRNK